MENINLTYIQRTATGRDQTATTTVNVYRWTTDDTLVITSDPHYFRGIPVDDYALEIVYTIHHPAVMAGSVEDIVSAFYRKVEADLAAKGFISKNDAGVTFWEG